jgi:hypothetical protein
MVEGGDGRAGLEIGKRGEWVGWRVVGQKSACA